MNTARFSYRTAAAVLVGLALLGLGGVYLARPWATVAVDPEVPSQPQISGSSSPQRRIFSTTM